MILCQKDQKLYHCRSTNDEDDDDDNDDDNNDDDNNEIKDQSVIKCYPYTS